MVRQSYDLYYRTESVIRPVDDALAPFGLSLAKLLLVLLIGLAVLLSWYACRKLVGNVSAAQAERDMLLLSDAPRSDSQLPVRIDLALFPINYVVGACVGWSRAAYESAASGCSRAAHTLNSFADAAARACGRVCQSDEANGLSIGDGTRSQRRQNESSTTADVEAGLAPLMSMLRTAAARAEEALLRPSCVQVGKSFASAVEMARERSSAIAEHLRMRCASCAGWLGTGLGSMTAAKPSKAASTEGGWLGLPSDWSVLREEVVEIVVDTQQGVDPATQPELQSDDMQLTYDNISYHICSSPVVHEAQIIQEADARVVGAAETQPLEARTVSVPPAASAESSAMQSPPPAAAVVVPAAVVAPAAPGPAPVPPVVAPAAPVVAALSPAVPATPPPASVDGSRHAASPSMGQIAEECRPTEISVAVSPNVRSAARAAPSPPFAASPIEGFMAPLHPPQSAPAGRPQQQERRPEKTREEMLQEYEKQQKQEQEPAVEEADMAESSFMQVPLPRTGVYGLPDPEGGGGGGLVVANWPDHMEYSRSEYTADAAKSLADSALAATSNSTSPYGRAFGHSLLAVPATTAFEELRSAEMSAVEGPPRGYICGACAAVVEAAAAEALVHRPSASRVCEVEESLRAALLEVRARPPNGQRNSQMRFELQASVEARWSSHWAQVDLPALLRDTSLAARSLLSSDPALVTQTSNEMRGFFETLEAIFVYYASANLDAKALANVSSASGMDSMSPAGAAARSPTKTPAKSPAKTPAKTPAKMPARTPETGRAQGQPGGQASSDLTADRQPIPRTLGESGWLAFSTDVGLAGVADLAWFAPPNDLDRAESESGRRAVCEAALYRAVIERRAATRRVDRRATGGATNATVSAVRRRPQPHALLP